MRQTLLSIAVLLVTDFLPVGAGAATLQPQAINDAQWTQKAADKGAINAVLVKLQVLLDRAHFSPGEIDGKDGDNLKKAVAAYTQSRQLKPGMSPDLWQKLIEAADDPVIIERTLTDEDIRGPYAANIPSKMEEMKDLPSLAYGNAVEKLAERFHMSPQLLQALNPGETFERAGQTIFVANVSAPQLPDKVARIEVDKSRQTLKAFSKAGDLLAVYPVTVGSKEKPAPDGALKVTSVTKNPTYRYNPDYEFKGVKSNKPFTIKPGPNNPVGLVWIGLNKEGYGIHGTPEPAKVSKAESHGCIRLTNWDALQLASGTAKNATVDFVGDTATATTGAGAPGLRRR